MNTPDKLQELFNKLGEITLRKDMFNSQISDKWGGRPSQMQILKQRSLKAAEYYENLLSLKTVKKGDLFLELGAERAQRSQFLKHMYDVNVIALDISFYSLNYSKKVKQLFGFTKDIDLFCADIYNLPFCNHSISHIFCFETLHHFPNIKPVLKEVRRVLGNGEFYFDEEPFKRSLRTNIIPVKSEPFQNAHGIKEKVLKYVKYWFLHWPIIEEAYKVIENYQISMHEYLEGATLFDDYRINFTPIIPFINNVIFEKSKRRKFNAFFSFKRLLANLAGGNVKGIYKSSSKPSSNSIIGCPNCIIVDCDLPLNKISCRCPEICQLGALSIEGSSINLNRERCTLCLECLYNCLHQKIDRSPLIKNADGFFCPNCQKRFPVLDGVHFLFSDESFKRLYIDSGLLDHLPNG